MCLEILIAIFITMMAKQKTIINRTPRVRYVGPEGCGFIERRTFLVFNMK